MLCVSVATMAGVNTEVDNDAEIKRLTDKSRRFFDNHEWLNATAMYTLLAVQQPADVNVQSRLTVSRFMSGDQAGAVNQITRAMEAGIPLDTLMDKVLAASLETGSPSMYRNLLESVRTRVPWLGRTVDGLLLRYYNFRDNGPELIRQARIMLAGLPDNLDFMQLLARGYMLDNQPEAAANVWTRILAAHPDDRPTLLNLGMYYLLSNRRTEALPLLTRAYSLQPTPYIQKILDEKLK